MPCSICRQHGHNKLKCQQQPQQQQQSKPFPPIDSDIVAFVRGTLDLIDNVDDDSAYLTDSEPTSSHITVCLCSHKEFHCGYCLDNDGSIYSSDAERSTLYIQLPDELLDQLPRLEQQMEDGCFDNYELPWHSQCYCGGNRVNNRIIQLEVIHR